MIARSNTDIDDPPKFPGWEHDDGRRAGESDDKSGASQNDADANDPVCPGDGEIGPDREQSASRSTKPQEATKDTLALTLRKRHKSSEWGHKSNHTGTLPPLPTGKPAHVRVPPSHRHLDAAIDREPSLAGFSKDRLREIREARRLSQGQLAIKVGVSVAAIKNHEAGRNVPREPIKQRLAAVLDVPVTTFYKPKGSPVPKPKRRGNKAVRAIIASLSIAYSAQNIVRIEGNPDLFGLFNTMLLQLDVDRNRKKCR